MYIMDYKEEITLCFHQNLKRHIHKNIKYNNKINQIRTVFHIRNLILSE